MHPQSNNLIVSYTSSRIASHDLAIFQSGADELALNHRLSGYRALLWLYNRLYRRKWCSGCCADSKHALRTSCSYCNRGKPCHRRYSVGGYLICLLQERKRGIEVGYMAGLGAVLGAQAGSRLATYIPKFEFRWNSALEVLGPMREVDLCVELKRVVASFAVGFSRRNCKRSVRCRGGVMLLLKYPIHKAIGTLTFILAVTALSCVIGFIHSTVHTP